MNRLHILSLSLIVTLLVWLVISWPLPRYLTTGIPSSSQNIESPPVRTMIPGDHLQLMYHFWLFADMVRGETPWFHNLYEFNTGDDAARLEWDAYYFPFSGLYAVFEAMGGQAFGWNVTGFVSIWLTYLATWILVARITGKYRWGAVFGLLGILIPYRWHALFSGSPTGFAMVWVPIMMVGLESAVRRHRLSGGIWAGVSLMLALWSDLHVFYFSALFFPVWAFACFYLMPVADPASVDVSFSIRIRKVILALSPVGIFAGLMLGYVVIMKRQLSESVMAEGRTLEEALIYSQRIWAAILPNSTHYVGITMLLGLGVAGLLMVSRLRKLVESWPREVGLWIFLLLGLGVIMALAAGPLGPNGGWMFAAARRFIPSYVMIRQPGKVLALLPPVLALSGAIGFLLLTRIRNLDRYATGIVAVLGVVLLLEYVPQVQATISLVETEQGAYAAVAADAVERGMIPRVVVITLWPGDSHFASIYQHYAALYRIRLLNGYRPGVGADYVEQVFRRFESLNIGYITSDQLADLLDMGIHYMLLHEDLYPEQVSAFPVGHTLASLREDPRLELLNQDGPVWAFRIQPDAIEMDAPMPAEREMYAPARWWRSHQMRYPEGRRQAMIGEDGFAVVSAPDSITTQYIELRELEGLRWMLRLRGEGEVRAEIHARASGLVHSHVLQIEAGTWEWFPVPVNVSGRDFLQLRIAVDAGEIVFDRAFVTAGSHVDLAVGESLMWPAPLLFRAGYTDVEANAVILRPDWEREYPILYGPHLPLAPGSYEVEFLFEADAPDGTVVGELIVAYSHAWSGRSQRLEAGKPARVEWTQEDHYPVWVQLRYARNAPVAIAGVQVTRIE